MMFTGLKFVFDNRNDTSNRTQPPERDLGGKKQCPSALDVRTTNTVMESGDEYVRCAITVHCLVHILRRSHCARSEALEHHLYCSPNLDKYSTVIARYATLSAKPSILAAGCL